MCDHSNESYSAVLPCGTVYYAVQGDERLVCDHSNGKAIEQYFHVILFIMLYIACSAGVFWRVRLIKREPSWIQTRKRLGEKVNMEANSNIRRIYDREL